MILMFLPVTCFSQKPKVDYLIFGVYCGECIGHCATMYKVEEEKIIVDTSNAYFWHNYWHNYPGRNDTALFTGCEGTNGLYLLAKPVMDSIPVSLLDSNLHSCTFGAPDSRDQCGIYLEISYNGKVKKFYIDTDTSDLPPWLLGYQALIKKTERQFYGTHWCK